MVPSLSAVIGASPVGIEDKFAAPARATPDEQSVFIGRMFESLRSQALMKAPEAEKRIFEDLSYSTPTTGPGWADKLMGKMKRGIYHVDRVSNGSIRLLTNEVWHRLRDPKPCTSGQQQR